MQRLCINLYVTPSRKTRHKEHTMSENDKKIDDHVLQRLFNSDMPLVLYIGRKLQELSEVVINFPWSCVVTSQPGSDFAVKFREENKREVEELKTVTQIDDSVIY